jgi:hypothetical protein
MSRMSYLIVSTGEASRFTPCHVFEKSEVLLVLCVTAGRHLRHLVRGMHAFGGAFNLHTPTSSHITVSLLVWFFRTTLALCQSVIIMSQHAPTCAQTPTWWWIPHSPWLSAAFPCSMSNRWLRPLAACGAMRGRRQYAGIWRAGATKRSKTSS